MQKVLWSWSPFKRISGPCVIVSRAGCGERLPLVGMAARLDSVHSRWMSNSTATGGAPVFSRLHVMHHKHPPHCELILDFGVHKTQCRTNVSSGLNDEAVTFEINCAPSVGESTRPQANYSTSAAKMVSSSILCPDRCVVLSIL